MICVLTTEQQRKFRKKVAKNLLDITEQNTPFSVKEYATSVYNRVLEKTQNSDLALTYAALAPLYIDQIASADRNVKMALMDKNVSFDEIARMVRDFGNEETGLEAVKTTLGIAANIVGDVRNMNESLQQQTQEPPVQAPPVTPSVSANQPVPDPDLRTSSSKKQFNAAKPTIMATRTQEAISDKKGDPNYNVPNPVLVPFFKTIRDVLTKLFSPVVDRDANKIEIVPGMPGVKLRLMPINQIDRSKVLSRDLQPAEANKPSNYDSNEPVLVLTDKYGQPIFFNDNGEYDPNGTPRYYYFRQLYSGNFDAQGNLQPYRAVTPGTADDYSRIDALARQKRISKEEARAQIIKDLELVQKLRKALKDNPDEMLLMDITGGSMGYADWDFNTFTRLSSIDFAGENIRFESAKTEGGVVDLGRVVFTTKQLPGLKIELERPVIKDSPNMVDLLANLMTQDLVEKNSVGDTVKVSVQKRIDYINQYFMTRQEGLDVYSNEDGSFTVKLMGNVIYQSLPTLYKNQQGDFVNREVAPTAQELAENELMGQTARTEIKNYLSNLQVQAKPLDSNSVTDFQKRKAISGTNFYDPQTRSKFTKPGDIFYNTATGLYYSVQYPKGNVKADLLNRNFSDLSIAREGDRFMVNQTEKPYNDYIKENFTIHYPLNAQRQLFRLNAYLSFEPTSSTMEKINPRVEPRVETPVATSTTTDATVPPVQTSALRDAMNNPELDKGIDVKKDELKATEAQIEAARKWYENHPLSKYFPFEAMFTMVNSKNRRAVATWSMQGITLYRGSDYSDLYHEAWHGFTQAFLSPAQKKALYAEAGKMSGSFVDYKGNTVKFSDADEKQLEEYLAEDFRKWMLKGGKADIAQPVKKTIFQKILDFLKALFGDLTYDEVVADSKALRTIHTLYEKLRVGNLSEYTFSEDNATFGVLEKGMMAIKEDASVKSLSYEDSRYLVELTDSLMSEFVDEFSKNKRSSGNISYKWTSTLLKKKAGLKLAYQHVLERSINTRNALKAKLDAATEDVVKNSLTKQVQRLDWFIDNFGNVDNLLENRPKKGEDTRSVIAYHMLKSQVLEPETKEGFFDEDVTKEEDLWSKGREGYDKGGNELSHQEMASTEILFLMRSLHKVDKNGQPVYMPGTEYEYEENGVKKKAGVPQLESFDRVWNATAKLLQNTLNIETMFAKLAEYRKNNKDFPMAQLMDKMGPVDTTGTTEWHLWTNFWQTFNKSRVPLVQAGVEIVNVNKEGKALNFENWRYEIKIGQSSGNIKRVATDWEHYFASAKTRFIKPDKNGVNYLDMAEVIKAYPKAPTGAKEQLAFLRDIGFLLEEDNLDIENALLDEQFDAKPFWYVISKLNKRRDNSGKPAVKITRLSHLKEKYPSFQGKDDNGRDVTYPELEGEGQNWNKILEAEAKYSDLRGNFMVTNAEGNTQFEHTLNNSLTIMVNAVNDVSTYQELINLPWMRHLDVKRNPWAKSSVWLNSIFDMEDLDGEGNIIGKKRLDPKGQPVKFVLENLSGVAVEKNGEFENEKGISSAKADVVTKLLMDLHLSILRGSPELMRHADKGTSFSVFVSRIYNPKVSTKAGQLATAYVPTIQLLRDLKNDNNQSLGYSEGDENMFSNYMLGYINAEHARIRQLRKMAKDGATDFDFKYLTNGRGFVAFSDVLTIDTKKALLKLDQDLDTYLKQNTEDARALRNAMKTDVIQYFNKETARVMDMFKNARGIDGKLLVGKSVLTKLSGQIRNENLGSDNLKTGAQENALVKSFVINSWIHNMESVSVIYGDPALYNMKKEEFHKRNAGVGSTGTIYRTDSLAMDYVNGVLGRGYRKKRFPEKQEDYPFDGRMNTAVVRDNEIRSTYFSQYADALIKDEMARTNVSRQEAEAKVLGAERDKDGNITKLGTVSDPIEGGLIYAYQKMNEGDAQGWITFDSYRILLNLEGKWSDQQEEMYQKIINGQDIDHRTLTQFFPPQKLQYFGPLDTEGLPITAFHKFSLFPLVPTVIKGTKLEDLHDKMVNENIDYALFQSGSKVGTITKEAKKKEKDGFTSFDPVYDKLYSSDGDRQISEETFTKNTIFLNYLKNQLEIAPEFKEKVTFSTQLRKLIEDGLIEGGVPVDFRKDVKNINQRRALWKALRTEEARERESPKYKLYKKYESNVQKLTELKKLELLDEMNWKMVNGKPEGSLKNLLEFVRKEMTRQEMADHEIDFVDLGYGGNKIKHDFSMSLSAEKIEKMLNSIVTRRLIKQKVNGEALIQVSGAGFETASSTGRDYTNPTDEQRKRWGTNDLPTYHKKADGTTAAMKVKVAMQGQFKKLLNLRDKEGNRIGTVDKLNTLLQDEEWLNTADHRRMITMVGVRIPVQGLNSMEFMEVYEFLPEEAGNIIVPPAEIVAKSGSDFDIDKLTVMMPSYTTEIQEDGSRRITMARQRTKQEVDKLYAQYERYYVEKERALTEVSPVTGSLEDLAPFNSLLFSIFGDTAENLDAELADILREEGKISSKEDFARKLNGTKAVENDLIWNIKEILELEDNFATLIKPNGTDIVKPLADELASKVTQYNPKQRLSGELSAEDAAELGEIPGQIAGTRIFEIGYNQYKHSSNNIGKQTLGLGAVDNTFNSIFNRIGAYLLPVAKVPTKRGSKQTFDVVQTLRVPHNTLDINGQQAISLSHIMAKDGNRISDVISQLINGWVDIAKDAWIFNIQGNKEIAPILLFMVQAGVPFKTAVYLASQPIVREYVEAQRRAKSTFGDMMGTAPEKGAMMFRVEARSKILSDGRFNFLEDLNLNARDVNKKAVFYKKTEDFLDRTLGATNEFSEADLKKEIEDHAEALEKGEEPKYSDVQKAAFLHFIQIEEMATAVRDVKMSMNFDTSKSDSLFDAQNRTLMLQKLRENGRLPEHLVDDILKETIIGSFYVQPFQLEIWKDLFPLRNSKVLNDWLAEKLASNIADDVNATFGDAEVFSNELRNDLVNFIFQNTLKNFNIGKLTHYKGEAVEDIMASKLNEAEKIKSLSIGVFFKDGKAYYDRRSLDRQYAGQLYNKAEYEELGLAKLPITTFSSKEEYFHYVFEREYLRSLYPKLSDVEKSAEYAWIAGNVKSNTKRKQGETDEAFASRLKTLSYEEFLKEKALENIFNTDKIFKGELSFADKLVMIKENYGKELAEQFSIIEALVPNSGGGVNNVVLKSKLDDPDKLNLYYENVVSLADPTVKKLEDPMANQMVSEFFAMLPLVGFLQSGMSTKSMFSINRAMPQDLFIRLMERPIKEYTEKLNPLALDFFYEKFLSQNSLSSRSKTRKRFKDYYSQDFSLDETYKLHKEGVKEYSPRPYAEEAKTLIGTNEDGVTVMSSSMINLDVATAMAAENPDSIFVFNDAFQAVPLTFPQRLLQDRNFRGLPISNKFGLPTYTVYSVTENSAVKDINGTIAPFMKQKIDDAIDSLKAEAERGMKLVFNSSGYGQEWIGNFIDPKYKDIRARAEQTFLYLSERLYKEFGYVNPGYDLTTQGKKTLQELQPITDDDVREFMLNCYR
jgi:hypothetical protein